MEKFAKVTEQRPSWRWIASQTRTMPASSDVICARPWLMLSPTIAILMLADVIAICAVVRLPCQPRSALVACSPAACASITCRIAPPRSNLALREMPRTGPTRCPQLIANVPSPIRLAPSRSSAERSAAASPMGYPSALSLTHAPVASELERITDRSFQSDE